MSSVPPFNFPIVITASGLQPTPPASILAQLLAAVAAQQPGYTANLPGILLEDISSTEVGGVVLCNQMQVDSVNSLTPLGANEFLLVQLGQMLGFQQGQPTNTSVPVVFSGAVGFVIQNGFLVGDGTNSYQVQTGGPILSGGSSATMTAICTSSAVFVPAENTVTVLQTSVPSNVQLSVNNPGTGTAGNPNGESFYAYRARIQQGNLAAGVGTARFIKTQLEQIPGVTAQNVAVQQASGGGIRVIASGADTVAIAYAILIGVADPSQLVGSAIDSGRNVTVSLYDYPDTYNVTYVSTQTQTVTSLVATWNTSLSSFTGGSAIQGLIQQPFANYILSLAPGQPINELELTAIFQAAVSGLIDPTLITRLVYSVYIDSTLTPPASGYATVVGDAESNWFVAPPSITAVQG